MIEIFKKDVKYIVDLGILNTSFGLKFMSENPLVKLTEFPTAHFWEIGMPIINLIIPLLKNVRGCKFDNERVVLK